MSDRAPERFVAPRSPQGKAALKYILASQKACSADDWEEIIRLAVADAKCTTNAKTRSEARNFLSRVLMPRDPIQVLHLFASQYSLDELRDYIQKMKEARKELSEMAAGNGSRIHDVEPVEDRPS